MAGMHGDLFTEIGRLVVAAHAGQAIDLTATSEDLAERYANLRVPAEAIARAIARSLGAVGLSLALVDPKLGMTADRSGELDPESAHLDADIEPELVDQERSASVLFPSGVRLAVLS